MRIGIMTFHASNNCGSMLQAYALQKTLLNLGYKNEIVDYSNKAQRHMYALFRFPTNYHDVLHDISAIILYSVFKKHNDSYIEFKKKNFLLSSKSIKNHFELDKIKDDYDIFIAGSDQVWNTNCPDADDAYYLNFTENKKVAYAPSFGNTNINCETKNPILYKTYLDSFTGISIREENGAKWIERLTGKKCPVLLDPSLLLDMNEYIKLAGKERVIKEKYIFYYAFSYSDEVNAYVEKISKQLQLPVYIIDAKNWLKRAWKYKIKLYKESGPCVFLNLLFNAELVLTTSFHGTAFSLIAEKKFWFIDSSMRNPEDDRALTLLKSVCLENRMLLGEELLKKDLNEIIKYKEVNTLLEEKKAISINWLAEQLEQCAR